MVETRVMKQTMFLPFTVIWFFLVDIWYRGAALILVHILLEQKKKEFTFF